MKYTEQQELLTKGPEKHQQLEKIRNTVSLKSIQDVINKLNASLEKGDLNEVIYHLFCFDQLIEKIKPHLSKKKIANKKGNIDFSVADAITLLNEAYPELKEAYPELKEGIGCTSKGGAQGAILQNALQILLEDAAEDPSQVTKYTVPSTLFKLFAGLTNINFTNISDEDYQKAVSLVKQEGWNLDTAIAKYFVKNPQTPIPPRVKELFYNGYWSQTYAEDSSVCQAAKNDIEVAPKLQSGNVLHEMNRGQVEIDGCPFAELANIEDFKTKLTGAVKKATGHTELGDNEKKVIAYILENAHQGYVLAGGFSTINSYIKQINQINDTRGDTSIGVFGEIDKIRITTQTDGAVEISIQYKFISYRALKPDGRTVKECGSTLTQYKDPDIFTFNSQKFREDVKNHSPYLTVENKVRFFVDKPTDKATYKIIEETRTIHKDIKIVGKKFSEHFPQIKNPDFKLPVTQPIVQPKPKVVNSNKIDKNEIDSTAFKRLMGVMIAVPLFVLVPT